MNKAASTSRIDSMDQFRGYTMAGMFLVNFIGAFAVVHPVLKHHNNYHSYADTIMPQFFFAVGFSLRLALVRNIGKMGRTAACTKAVKRCLALLLIGLVVYHLDGQFGRWEDLRNLGVAGFFARSFWRSPFQALVHIAITSLWVLPVIAASARIRVLFLTGTALLHFLLSRWFWYALLWDKKGIDGGQLGFLTWAIPTLLGSMAFDWVAKRGSREAMKPLLRWGVTLSVFGYALSCLNAVFNPVKQGGLSRFLVEPPFWPPSRPADIWTMSQRAGSNSYLWFATGFSLLVYAAFVWWTDLKGKQLGMFRVFGLNPLAGYIIHDIVADAIHPFAPPDSRCTGWPSFSPSTSVSPGCSFGGSTSRRSTSACSPGRDGGSRLHRGAGAAIKGSSPLAPDIRLNRRSDETSIRPAPRLLRLVLLRERPQ